jgi:hypothetical protein
MVRSKLSSIRPVICLALFAMLGMPVAADEMTDVYKQLYTNAKDLTEKYTVMMYIIELKDPAIAPMLSDSLANLLLQQESMKSQSDKEAYFKLVKLIAAGIGEYKYRKAEAFLWDLVVSSSDPLVKAEGLIALGKVNAVGYSEKIALLLRDLNFEPTEDTDAGEKIAYGAILALESLKDPKGWAPIFHASDGWYTKRIKQTAERALPNIAEDPTDIIKGILPDEPVSRKILALDQEFVSMARDGRKIELSIFALSEGHKVQGKDRAEQAEFGNLRRNAIVGLIQLKSKSAAALPYLKLSYDIGETDEKLVALQALGVDGGNEATTMLRNIILDLDKLRKDDIYDATKERLARAAIQNAGITRNPAAKAALLAVILNTKWSVSVKNAAEAALKLIP